MHRNQTRPVFSPCPCIFIHATQSIPARQELCDWSIHRCSNWLSAGACGCLPCGANSLSMQTLTANSICVALDTPEVDRAVHLARTLKTHVGYLKVGLEFFYAHGAKGYEVVASVGVPIFLDLKLHDIPNTVEQGLRALMQLAPAPAIVNIHAQGGLAMMQAARAAVPASTKLIAVTVLTSLSHDDCILTGHDPALATADLALVLAQLAHDAALDGVVCSPLDLNVIRKVLPRPFLTVVPGIRPEGVGSQDQKRIATPKAAVAAGADVLVIGRAITSAADPVAAAQNILKGLA
jgi:orotidine-5'-phosphate decarboxylase